MVRISTLILFFLTVGMAGKTLSCTSYLVTPGATVDGSSMISYAADSHIRYGELYYRPGGPQPEDSYFQAYYRGSHKPLAKIPHPEHIYTVIGFMNEKQVAIGESTFGGREELFDTTGEIDYSSLMMLAMHWASDAREAIQIIAELVEEYGYYSSGESFSIADPNEVWYMEIIGKGVDLQEDEYGGFYNANKGAVWVAKRIPDGYVSAHANQARITTFPQQDDPVSITCAQFDRLHDPEVRVVYSEDVISFAREQGYFSGSDQDFSFADAYAPINFGKARFCEARVWSMFNRVRSDMDPYFDYAMGYDMENRMPLYVKPEEKLSVEDLFAFKRDYLQGTPYDKSQDVGGGPFNSPYRWVPLRWEYDGKMYFNERTTVTQQTGFSYIAQLRGDYPDHIGGITWFGVDDTNMTVYVPMYAGIRRAPDAYKEGYGSILEYKDDAAFWVFNKVAHFVYLRYSLKIEDVRKVQSSLENKFLAYVPVIDEAATSLYQEDPELARDFLTEFSVNMGNHTVERWEELYRFLMVKYLDGNVKKEKDGEFLTNEYGKYPIVEHPGYPEWWREVIIKHTGDRFRIPE